MTPPLPHLSKYFLHSLLFPWELHISHLFPFLLESTLTYLLNFMFFNFTAKKTLCLVTLRLSSDWLSSFHHYLGKLYKMGHDCTLDIIQGMLLQETVVRKYLSYHHLHQEWDTDIIRISLAHHKFNQSLSLMSTSASCLCIYIIKSICVYILCFWPSSVLAVFTSLKKSDISVCCMPRLTQLNLRHITMYTLRLYHHHYWRIMKQCNPASILVQVVCSKNIQNGGKIIQNNLASQNS